MLKYDTYNLLLASFLQISLRNILSSRNVCSSVSNTFCFWASESGVGAGVGALGKLGGVLGLKRGDRGCFKQLSVNNGLKKFRRCSSVGVVSS